MSGGDALDVLLADKAGRDLSAEYARRVDAVDIDGIVGLFAEDGVLDIVSEQFVGRDAIRGFYTRALVTEVRRRHFVVNHRITLISDEVATMDSYFWFTFAGAPESIIGWGDYRDRIHLGTNGARFVKRRIELDRQVSLEQGWAKRA